MNEHALKPAFEPGADSTEITGVIERSELSLSAIIVLNSQKCCVNYQRRIKFDVSIYLHLLAKYGHRLYRQLSVVSSV